MLEQLYWDYSCFCLFLPVHAMLYSGWSNSHYIIVGYMIILYTDASREFVPNIFLVPPLLWPFALGGQSPFSSQLPWRMYSIYAQIDLSQFTPYFICHTTSLCKQHWDADCCTRWFGLASNKITYKEYVVFSSLLHTVTITSIINRQAP